MTSWSDFAAAEPDFANRVRERFAAYRHHTMATVRRDGAPRLSGTEVEFDDRDLAIGIMTGARRADDLRRDPRVAIHSHCVDPPEGDDTAWPGEAKVAGTAVEDRQASGEAEFDAEGTRFRIELGEVVLTRLGTPPDHLVIESWRPERGLRRVERR
jgi:hypothetical protein